MSTEIKTLSDALNTAATEIKGRLSTLESDIEKLDKKQADIEIQSKRFYGGGDMMGDSSSPELKAFLQKGLMPMESKELSVTNDGQGVTVRSDWSDRIFKQVRESSPMREVASVMTTTSNELEVLVDRDEPNSEWIGELGTRGKTAASFMTRQSIPVFEHYAMPEATLQMLEDSQFDVEQWLQGKVSSRFTRQESFAFFSGDGTDRPRGILDYGTIAEADFTWPADPANYQIGAVYSGVSADLADADYLFDLVDSLKSAYLPGASFLMTRAMRNVIRKLKDNEDRYLLQPSLTSGVPDTLLGYPVNLAEDMPGLVADSVGVLFGNFSEAYTIVDRIGLTVQRDSYTKPGWVKWLVRRRIGGALTNPEAVKALVLGVEPA